MQVCNGVAAQPVFWLFPWFLDRYPNCNHGNMAWHTDFHGDVAKPIQGRWGNAGRLTSCLRRVNSSTSCQDVSRQEVNITMEIFTVCVQWDALVNHFCDCVCVCVCT